MLTQRGVHFFVRPAEMMAEFMDDDVGDELLQGHVRTGFELRQQGFAVEKDPGRLGAWIGDALMDQGHALIETGEVHRIGDVKLGEDLRLGEILDVDDDAPGCLSEFGGQGGIGLFGERLEFLEAGLAGRNGYSSAVQ